MGWFVGLGQAAQGVEALNLDEPVVAGVADVSTSDTLRSASNADTTLGVPLGQMSSASAQDVPQGDARRTSDVPTNSDLPRDWDHLSWLQKAKAYVTDIIPHAVTDTFGMSGDPGASTITGTIRSALPSTSTFLLSLVLGVVGLFLLLLIVRKV